MLARLQVSARKFDKKLELIFIDGPLPVEEDHPLRKAQEAIFKGMQFYEFARWTKDADFRSSEQFKDELLKRFPLESDLSAHLEAHPEDLVRSTSLRKYDGLESALEYLQTQLRQHSPIHGVLGFSQGANLASLLAAQSVSGEGAFFHFVVHICAGRPGWVQQRPELFHRPLPMQSLHISGEKDITVPLSLQHLYENPTCMTHNDGHRPIPGTSADEANRVANAIVGFILSQPLEQHSSSSATLAALPAVPSELAVVIFFDRESDIKSEMVIMRGTTVWQIKERIARDHPGGEIRPELIKFRKTSADSFLSDSHVITEHDTELEIA